MAHRAVHWICNALRGKMVTVSVLTFICPTGLKQSLLADPLGCAIVTLSPSPRELSLARALRHQAAGTQGLLGTLYPWVQLTKGTTNINQVLLHRYYGKY